MQKSMPLNHEFINESINEFSFMRTKEESTEIDLAHFKLLSSSSICVALSNACTKYVMHERLT